MAFRSAQVTVSATTPTPLLPTNRFPTLGGTLADPIPVIVQNTDAAITVFIGGPDVSLTNGFQLLKGAQITVSIEAKTAVPYAIAASGSPVVAVLATRQ